MKKIVIITNMMAFYRLDLFNELASRREYDFHIIFSTEREKNNRNWEIDTKGLHFNYTILESKQIVRSSAGIVESRIIHIPKNIWKTLRNLNPDVIIASEYNPTSMAAFFYSKLHSRKFISWSDGTLNSERFISKAQRFTRGVICRNSNWLIASSTETMEAQIAYGAAPEKVSLSYLTIDTEDFVRKLGLIETSENKVPKILFCSYLFKRKGAHLLIEALKNVKADFTLEIVGTGEEEGSLRLLAKESSVEHKVYFNGYKTRDEITRYYRQTDVFVFPSTLDAFGLVLIEALAAGLPIIASKYAGGSRDAVEDGINGYIIDPEMIEEFTAKLELLLSNSEMRARMGRASFERKDSFYMSRVAQGFYNAIAGCESEP